MKTPLAFAGLALAQLSTALAQTPATAQQADFTNQRSVLVSPEVHDDRRVTLRVRAPEAKRVTLAGGTLLLAVGGSAQRMSEFTRGEGGVWTLTLGPVAPDIHNYRLQIDGADAIDWANPNVILGNGSPNSFVEVPPTEGSAYWSPRPGTPAGVVHRHVYASALGDVRELYVYTPPGYAEGKEPLPVLYLLHGGGELAQSWSTIGRVNIIADNLLAAGKMKPMLIVMPLGHGLPRTPATNPGNPDWSRRNGEAFQRDLLTAVMPLAETTYRARRDRDGRALAGLSMGASQTEQIGFTQLETFASLAMFSGGGRDFATRHANFLASAEAKTRLRHLYLAVGTRDGLALSNVRGMHEALEKAGVPHTYSELKDFGHSWPIWRHILWHEYLPALFR